MLSLCDFMGRSAHRVTQCGPQKERTFMVEIEHLTVLA